MNEQQAYDWIQEYANGGKKCIDCPNSEPVTPGYGHICKTLERKQFDPLDCPAFPESELPTDGKGQPG